MARHRSTGPERPTGKRPDSPYGQHASVQHMHTFLLLVAEGVVQEPQHFPYSPFILVSNLRAHLYVALEKNGWLQKRIEELEEERNFLRCQLDRFIVSMRTQEGRSMKVQPDSSPSPPSPMTTRSGMALKRLQGGSRIRRDEFVEEEEEEEDEESSVEKGSKKSRSKTSAEPRMKMRRIFRITHGRERQRVKDPDGVLIRYKKILTTYQRVRSMNTMASTSPSPNFLYQLLYVCLRQVAEVGEFEASKEKLLDYARRCYKSMDEEIHSVVQNLKKTHKLLPISYRFRN
uniref:Coiled-coil domain containing 106b n=1 Tax=Neogobius melanostomus TaxID=47308 RepID=A0A8C6WRV2_9GOBI